MKRSCFCWAFVAAALALPLAGSAQSFSTFAEVKFSIANGDYSLPGGGVFFYDYDSTGSIGNGSLAELSTYAEWTGLDQDYSERTMTWDGSGKAQAGFGLAKTMYGGGLYNTFYNAENAPAYNSVTREYDPSGIPDIFNGSALAGWTDTLIYGGTAVGYTSTYIFNITGTNGPGTNFSYLDVQIGSNANERFFFDWDGAGSQVVRTQGAFIGSEGQKATIQMNSWFQGYTPNFSAGQDTEGFSDFFSTVTLTGIEVYDAQGNLVSNVTINGASGTSYNPVPEPGAFLACSVGALVFLARRKAKKA